ncbi:CRISPR-associated ring nuclease Csm6 [Methylacidiphilum caldifontis]|uniref:CRISPR-associated protein n=1 Tax=Methylacidiphilum caldifontis TaxID=2795386 RepID=A0A4Y8P9I8_9BACT|nr:CRISPR-associated ring nuclease Csm6 [Methylacidiphilum caldifontis]TFE65864.1 CRISPR-associated protein [Methylacidiphilum caldifontis]
MKSKEKILLAVVGTTPAVITETIWALAHEDPPWIPHYIDILTTTVGHQVIKNELCAKGINNKDLWDEFREWLIKVKGAEENSLHLRNTIEIQSSFHQEGRCKPLEDICSMKDNEDAADCILEEVRKIVENPDTELIASVAGGRKTLGILLYASVSLLGREQDKLTHVLVNEPYDNPNLQPKFYYPEQKEQNLKTPSGSTIFARNAQIKLAYIPFVHFSFLFKSQLGRSPGRFTELVKQYSNMIKTLKPSFSVDLPTKTFIIENTKIPLKGKNFLFLAFLWDRKNKQLPPFECHKEIDKPFKEFLEEWKKNNPSIESSIRDWHPENEDYKKILTNLRKELIKKGIGQYTEYLFPHRGPVGLPN